MPSDFVSIVSSERSFQTLALVGSSFSTSSAPSRPDFTLIGSSSVFDFGQILPLAIDLFIQ